MKGSGRRRHFHEVKTFVWLVLLTIPAIADNASDRAAVAQALLLLNAPQVDAAAFDNSEAKAEFDRLLETTLTEIVIPHGPPLSDDYWPFGAARLPVTCDRVRIIAPEVAMADGRVRLRPVLFLLRKRADRWRIVAVRQLR